MKKLMALKECPKNQSKCTRDDNSPVHGHTTLGGSAGSDQPGSKHTQSDTCSSKPQHFTARAHAEFQQSSSSLILIQTGQGNKCVSSTPVLGAVPSYTTHQLLKSNKSLRSQSRRHGQKTTSRNEREILSIYTLESASLVK